MPATLKSTAVHHPHGVFFICTGLYNGNVFQGCFMVPRFFSDDLAARNISTPDQLNTELKREVGPPTYPTEMLGFLCTAIDIPLKDEPTPLVTTYLFQAGPPPPFDSLLLTTLSRAPETIDVAHGKVFFDSQDASWNRGYVFVPSAALDGTIDSYQHALPLVEANAGHEKAMKFKGHHVGGDGVIPFALFMKIP